jgi:hypothetical protein
MSDMIFYKNGEETFRISPPTVGTKCPETKLEVKKMTEIEKTKKDIEVLTAKLALLEEIENHKTPCEEAYKRVYGFYPETYEDSWSSFQDGYIAAQKDYKVEEPEELKTLYDVLRELDKPMFTDDVCSAVKRWMSQYADNVMCGEYKKGYEYCLTVLEENLKND